MAWGRATQFDLFAELKNRERSLARQLSDGEQQMLAIARAMLARPLMLMLDEPSMGLAVLVKDRIAQSIKDISNSEKADGFVTIVPRRDIMEINEWSDTFWFSAYQSKKGGSPCQSIYHLVFT